jgi:hypothetical protein
LSKLSPISVVVGGEEETALRQVEEFVLLGEKLALEFLESRVAASGLEIVRVLRPGFDQAIERFRGAALDGDAVVGVDRKRRAEGHTNGGKLLRYFRPQRLVLCPVPPEVGRRQVGMTAQALDVLDHLRTAAIRVVTAPSIPVVGGITRFGDAFR